MYVEITVVSVLALPGKQLRPLLLMIDTTDFSSVDGWIDITTASYQLLLVNTNKTNNYIMSKCIVQPVT